MYVSILENHSTTPVVITDIEEVTLQLNLIHVGIVKKNLLTISVLVRLMKQVHIKENSYTLKHCGKSVNLPPSPEHS